MDLAGKYDKSNLLGDGEVQVWRGRERSRGTPVLMHTFPGSPRVLRLAVEYLLMRPASSPLLDVGEIDGATCLVTQSELDYLDIGAWLQNAITAGPAAAMPAAPPAEMRTAPRTETITVPMRPAAPPSVAPAATAHLPTAPPPAAPPAAAPPAAAPPAAPQGPGEFTRAFQLPGSNAPKEPSADLLPASGPVKPAPAPGEFTRLFQLPGKTGTQETTKIAESGPLASSPPAMPLSPAPAAPAGEFTRLFKAQPVQPGASGGTSLPAYPSPELSPESPAPRLNIASGPVGLPERNAPPAPKPPGEYTRVMQAPALSSTAPPAPAGPSPAAAQAVQLPVPSVSMPSAPAPPTLPVASLPSVPSVQPPTMPSAPASVPVAAPRSGISPVVLFLGGLILVAVILVLIFALRS